MSPSKSWCWLLLLVLFLLDFPPCSLALTFALCPKSVDNPFFEVVRDGCIDRTKSLKKLKDIDVECLYVGPSKTNQDGIEQAQIIRDLMDSQELHGLSISVSNVETLRPVIQEALRRDIPVVTFDSDDPESGRASYIGTDNFFFGQQLGKVLQQIHPQGGTYAIVTDTTPNIISRENGVRNAMQQESKRTWTELEPINANGNYTLAIELMREVASNTPNLTAIVPVMGGPMFLPDLWTNLVDDFPNVEFVVGDGLAVQLEFLSRGKVGGLVAQLPYNMGTMSVDSLLSLSTTKLTGLESAMPDFQGTNVLEHVRVPLILPELTVDQNHLGNLSILGYTLFGVVGLTAISLVVWTAMNHSVRVVRLAQPELLSLIGLGVLVMSASLIPLSFDDSSPSYTPEMGQRMCMSVPWLISLGFTLTFSALFAKLWRINHIFRSSGRYQRVTVRTIDVVIPMVLLLSANVATLLSWTFLDPLQYTRVDREGTDAWNRVIATYGTCTAERPWPYLGVLGVLNVGVLIVATVQAYRARGIESEFSESKHIAVAIVSMLQVSVIGIPLLVVVREDPKAWYLTFSFWIFLICMVVLLVTFVPKIIHARAHALRRDSSQRKLLSESIRQTQQNLYRQSGASSKPGGRSAVPELSTGSTGEFEPSAPMSGQKAKAAPQSSESLELSILSDYTESVNFNLPPIEETDSVPDGPPGIPLRQQSEFARSDEFSSHNDRSGTTNKSSTLSDPKSEPQTQNDDLVKYLGSSVISEITLSGELYASPRRVSFQDTEENDNSPVHHGVSALGAVKELSSRSVMDGSGRTSTNELQPPAMPSRRQSVFPEALGSSTENLTMQSSKSTLESSDSGLGPPAPRKQAEAGPPKHRVSEKTVPTQPTGSLSTIDAKHDGIPPCMPTRQESDFKMDLEDGSSVQGLPTGEFPRTSTNSMVAAPCIPIRQESDHRAVVADSSTELSTTDHNEDASKDSFDNVALPTPQRNQDEGIPSKSSYLLLGNPPLPTIDDRQDEVPPHMPTRRESTLNYQAGTPGLPATKRAGSSVRNSGKVAVPPLLPTRQKSSDRYGIVETSTEFSTPFQFEDSSSGDDGSGDKALLPSPILKRGELSPTNSSDILLPNIPLPATCGNKGEVPPHMPTRRESALSHLVNTAGVKAGGTLMKTIKRIAKPPKLPMRQVSTDADIEVSNITGVSIASQTKDATSKD